jgi:hypothetical protein
MKTQARLVPDGGQHLGCPIRVAPKLADAGSGVVIELFLGNGCKCKSNVGYSKLIGDGAIYSSDRTIVRVR